MVWSRLAQAGAAGDENRVDSGVVTEGFEDRPEGGGLVAEDSTPDDLMPRGNEQVDDDLAAGVGLEGAGVADGDDDATDRWGGVGAVLVGGGHLHLAKP